jgi:hypothetical protein
MGTGLATRLAIMLLALAPAPPAAARQRSAQKTGFTLPAGSGRTILLVRPSIRVGARSTGGMFEPNGDWTDQARRNIETALAAQQQALGNRVISAPVADGDAARLVADYAALFAAVSQSVIRYQFFAGDRLPTKKLATQAGRFDWTLGPGIARLPGASDADYALFLSTSDAYGSTGRKLLQPGIPLSAGEHAGYAGLVDLRTGDLLWLNADRAMGGDLRTPEGAATRVQQLLADFPGSTPAPR